MDAVSDRIGRPDPILGHKNSRFQKVSMIGRVDPEELIKIERLFDMEAIKPSLVKISFKGVRFIPRPRSPRLELLQLDQLMDLFRGWKAFGLEIGFHNHHRILEPGKAQRSVTDNEKLVGLL